MKQKRNILVIAALILFLGFSASFTNAQENRTPEAEFNRLSEIASQAGSVRVIVQIQVPNIEALTAVSTGFQTGNTDAVYIQAALDSDIILERAISNAADSVLLGLNNTHYAITAAYKTIPYIGLSVTPNALEKLKSTPGVLRIYEDKKVPLIEPINTQTNLQNANNGISFPMLEQSTDIIGAKDVWNCGFTGAGWYVAILDTGIMTSHEMFSGKTIIEQCYAQGANPDFPGGDCPNQQKEMSGTGAANHIHVSAYHGSHVAGVAAGNNHIDKFGVAKDANIIAVNVFSYFPQYQNILSWDSDQLKGLEYVYSLRNTYKIASVNLSLGGYRFTSFCDDDPLKPVIDNLKAAGIATVIASGNSGFCGAIGTPACISSAVAVGGTDKLDLPYDSGNWASHLLTLLAPAVSISSVFSASNSSYTTGTGTSVAVPHVSGAFAVMKQFNENLSVNQIISTFKSTGLAVKPICPDESPVPRLDLGKAFMSMLPIAPPSKLKVTRVTNKSLLQTEMINIITWEHSPYNTGKTITKYNVYLVQNNQKTLLTTIKSSDSPTYLHRKANPNAATYAITSTDASGLESIPAYCNINL